MIIVTGAYGFIGSCMVTYLLRHTEEDVLAVDDFMDVRKEKNLPSDARITRIDRNELWTYLSSHDHTYKACIHLGARTDTVESREQIFDQLNVKYSQRIWEYCTKHKIPLIYASSAATYGDGDLGFKDQHALIPRLQPLNAYGWSKQEFDLWALSRKHAPPKWIGLKFFNVYGPNEYHKHRMASVIYHSFQQIKDTGKMKLFKSHHPEYADGEQCRDFIYIKDVISTIHWLILHAIENGIYNLGTGKARTFRDLTLSTFRALDVEPIINYIDTPIDIRENYQYFTEASMDKLRSQGFDLEFYSLERGIEDYVKNYLVDGRYY